MKKPITFYMVLHLQNLLLIHQFFFIYEGKPLPMNSRIVLKMMENIRPFWNILKLVTNLLPLFLIKMMEEIYHFQL